MKKISLLKIALFILGIIFLFLLVRKAGIKEILRAVEGARIELIILGLVFYLALVLIRAFKWFFIAKKFKPDLKYKKFLPFYLINYILGNISPLKSGETITPFIFKKYLNIPFGQGLSVVFLDRLLELIIFSLFFLSAVIYIIMSGILNHASFISIIIASAVLIFLISAVIAIIKRQSYAFKIISYLKRISVTKKTALFLEKELDVFYSSLKLLEKSYKKLILLTIFSWCLELLSFYFVFSSVIALPFFKVASSQIMSIAAAFVTFIPAGIGIGEIGTIYILKLFGFSVALTTAGVLLARVILTGTLALLGIIGILFIKRPEQLLQKT
jgi:uncharacterized protein (TIRG00374 family)